jgi:hypothetical protein
MFELHFMTFVSFSKSLPKEDRCSFTGEYVEFIVAWHESYGMQWSNVDWWINLKIIEVEEKSYLLSSPLRGLDWKSYYLQGKICHEKLYVKHCILSKYMALHIIECMFMRLGNVNGVHGG